MSRTMKLNDEEYTLTKKDAPLAILSLLQEYTDSEHPLNSLELSQKLKECYDIDMQPRSVSDNITALVKMGYEIEKNHSKDGKVYLANRVFNESQIIYLARLISNDKTSEMSNATFQALLNTLSQYDKEKYINSFGSDKEINKKNQDLFKNIALVDQAIKENKKISFYYSDNVFNGVEFKLVHRRDSAHNIPKLYELSPYYVFLFHHEYYVLGHLEGTDPLNENYTPNLFRIEYISKLLIDNMASYPKKNIPYFKGFNINKFIRWHHLPWTDKVYTADILVSEKYKKDMRYIFDDFGNNEDVLKSQTINNELHINLTNGINSLVFFLLSHPRGFTLQKKNTNDKVYKELKEQLDMLVKKYYTASELESLKQQLDNK